MSSPDAIVVGAGPNGLAAAIRLAQEGLSVLVLEARARPGGGATTDELTLPGFAHDVCSSVHPLGIGSPFLRTLPLADHGLEWIQPQTPLAHVVAGANAAALERDVGETAAGLGLDGAAWTRLMQPFATRAEDLFQDVLTPLRWPPHPFLMARFGLRAMRSAAGLARSVFETEGAAALFAGSAAHSAAPLDRPPTAAFGLVLTTAGHAFGWPFARGGSQSIIDAMVSYLGTLGGVVECSSPVRSLDALPPARIVLLDLTPRLVLEVAGGRLPGRYRRALERFRYGPGVFKVDWALSGPIPWLAEECRRAGTIHLGGTLGMIEHAERVTWNGGYPERPFILMAQPSVFDSTRAPAGKHTAWAYCHVPNGSDRDMTRQIEAEVERAAPGFKDLVLARSAMTARDIERLHPNFVGGDIAGGAMTLSQLFFRPVASPSPHRTPLPGVYLCSSATPPGGGVHGMCGFNAAETALKDMR